jgi:hypothetical protein
MRAEQAGDGWHIVPYLVRGEERMKLDEALSAGPGGVVVAHGRIALLKPGAPFHWLVHMKRAGPLTVAAHEAPDFLTHVLNLPDPPEFELPPELQVETREAVMQPRIAIAKSKRDYRYADTTLEATLTFAYGDAQVSAGSGRGIYDPRLRIYVRRDRAAEEAALRRLAALGFRPRMDQQNVWSLAQAKLPAVVRDLVNEGWHVHVDGSTVRSHATLDLEITSGVDWFDLHGKADFGGVSAELPELLRALARRETMVQLGDGTFGVLPEEWLQRFGGLAALGTAHNHLLRFHRTQAGLLDALLAAQPAIRIDETFARFREKLRAFGGVRSADQPAGFRGELRHYQKDGLGWMHFLREFDFGGCLADDMGVGKTAQVLALLETRRALRADGETIGPSLVVVPKSLVFNWKQEAERFTPQLRVLDYTGIGRNAKDVALWDLVVTTYGTLRQDAVELSGIEFDYVVLDEAQAIKNASTASAKAARLLRAKHRIAMSGTPVENHIGELWSLFEFLNPGMLGAVSAFKNLRNPDLEQRAMLARALRPFILRRTKEQVAAELPAKTEQTLYCEMEPEQRKLYDELRAHYRNTLLHRVQREGMARSKMHILEALLRLRQAACHPGLIDQKRADGASGKTELLLAQLREVLDEGHKALVFSQFTSLLAILREHLDAERIPYEYLDGATRDRQERVEHFQSDRACPLFLISLKAGGLGLNLTAADYVFLLDPWWNPAIEAQAIDRTHRIGQTKPVFAYRLIARDSIEEKVLELQKTKRDLASAIVTADNSLIGGLQREDLELLLS